MAMGGRLVRQEKPISAVNRNLAVFVFLGTKLKTLRRKTAIPEALVMTFQ
jgi:hypothetical protein